MPKLKNRFWNFVQNENTEEAELRIDGRIVDDEQAWLYEFLGIQSASPNIFRQELKNYSGQDLKVWINSKGGNVFAAIGIYNALMEHKNSGASVVTIGDAMVMSAGTLIYMSGDTRKASPGTMFMFHDPITDARGYAKDFRQIADILDEIKESTINIYQQATGKSRQEINSIMSNETYMNTNTAIDQGFVDEMLYSKAENNKEAQNEIQNLMINRLEILNLANDSMKSFIDFAKKNVVNREKNPENNKESEENNMPIKNSAELKNQLPEIHNEVFNSGAEAERQRLKEFDALNGKIDQDFLAEEKFKPENTAKDVLFKAMQEGKMINSSYIDDSLEDAENANKVEGAEADNVNNSEINNEKVEEKGILDAVKNVAENTIKSMRGGK